MIKMERAQLAKPPQKVPDVAPPEPAKDPVPDMMPTIMALAQSVQQVAQIVADSNQQTSAALAQLATQSDRKPTGMEAKVKRDKDGKMTRVLVEFTY